MDEDEGLDLPVSDILKAFELAGQHYNAKLRIDERLEARWQVALGIIDRALMECDRGVRFMELTNKLHDAEAELKELRKGQGGTFYIGGPQI